MSQNETKLQDKSKKNKDLKNKSQDKSKKNKDLKNKSKKRGGSSFKPTTPQPLKPESLGSTLSALNKKPKAKAINPKTPAARIDSLGRPRKTAITRPRKRPAKREIKSQKDLDKYTHEWYTYLKEKGFDDIEYYGPKKDGRQRFFMSTKNLKSIAESYDPQRELFFNMMRNYYAHIPRHQFPSSQVYWCFNHFSEGKSYREIDALLKKQNKYKHRSYFWVFTHLKPIIEKAIIWNTENEEGLLKSREKDLYLQDVLLNEQRWIELYGEVED